ncbi:hypothetical protein ACLKA6_013028 [Drosophila palustris]
MQLKCNNTREAQDNSSCHRKLSPDVDVEICAFCLDIKRDPVQLDCGHSYCRSCLELYCLARSWQANRCPLCRCNLGPQLIQRRRNWRLKIMLMLVLFLLSYGPFYLLLNYW